MRRGWGEPGLEGESRPAAPRRRWWWPLGGEEEELGEEEGDLHQCIVKEGMGRGVHGRGGGVTPLGSRHGCKRLELFFFQWGRKEGGGGGGRWWEEGVGWKTRDDQERKEFRDVKAVGFLKSTGETIFFYLFFFFLDIYEKKCHKNNL